MSSGTGLVCWRKGMLPTWPTDAFCGVTASVPSPSRCRYPALNRERASTAGRFDALSYSLRGFDPSGDNDEGLKALAAQIEAGLAGEQHVLLEVTAFARVGAGQEVFPSQELILDKGKGDKSRTLYQISGIAGLHSQKVGNALRTIDTWYPVDGDMPLGPIAVEPYGSVTTQGKAYRQPKDKADFYSLLDNWVLKDKEPTEGDQHFVMATLIRGGVFGEAG